MLRLIASAMEMSRPLRTKRDGAIGCGSLDKIQKIFVRDCEKSMEVKEAKRYFKSAGLFQSPGKKTMFLM